MNLRVLWRTSVSSIAISEWHHSHTSSNYQSERLDGRISVILDELIALFGACSLPATATNYDSQYTGERTTSGDLYEDVHSVLSTAEMIFEIRRLSGLSWDELASIFQVSRLSVHHWANGELPSARETYEISMTLAAVRDLYTGSQLATRERLFAKWGAGGSLFEMLVAHGFGGLLERAYEKAQVVAHRIPLSAETEYLFRPERPTLLLEADQTRPRVASDARVVHSVRVST